MDQDRVVSLVPKILAGRYFGCAVGLVVTDGEVDYRVVGLDADPAELLIVAAALTAAATKIRNDATVAALAQV